MSHHLVEFEGVSFDYPDGTRGLEDVSFRIVHGESVGIVGANGAGKSTLLMHINGTLMPRKGTVTVGDLRLSEKSKREIRRKVGMVFQNAEDQLFMPTVFEDVAFGPTNLGLEKDRVAERVSAALSTVGCAGLEDRPPHRLSGGQKSAVSIATVIAMGPDILVMDEPASNLDPGSRRKLIELLRRFEHTKIIASHDLDLVLDVCRRCIVMDGGKIVADGQAGELLRDRALLEANSLELPLSLQGRP